MTLPGPDRRFLPHPTIRGALFAGFAVVFALWLASGYELVRSIRAAEAQMALSRHAFVHGQQVLATITTQVMLGSIYLRDALMNPTTEMRAYYRRELTRLHEEVDSALPEYEPLVDD